MALDERVLMMNDGRRSPDLQEPSQVQGALPSWRIESCPGLTIAGAVPARLDLRRR